MTDDREPFREARAAERCSRCGSNRFVAVSLDRGLSRRAQCIPCGHIEPAALPRDWTSPHRRTDDRAEMQAARTAGLKARHEQRLENATYTAAEVKVLTEAALRLGRKEAADQIAQIHRPFAFGKTCPECHTTWPCITASACLKLAHPAHSDATSGRTDPEEGA